MPFKEDQGQPWYSNKEAGRKELDDLKKALGGFEERYDFDNSGHEDEARRKRDRYLAEEEWQKKIGGPKPPLEMLALPENSKNIGMETGNFPAPEGMDVDPVTEMLGVPEGFQFPAPPVQGPQDYPDNAPPKGPFNNPFGGGPNPPPLGPFPFPTTPKIPPPPLPPQR